MADAVYILPSASQERLDHTIQIWRQYGYDVAVLLTDSAIEVQDSAVIVIRENEYHGWYQAVNGLAKLLVGDYRLVVAGGDDIEPDPRREVGDLIQQFYNRFPDGYGVMQPIGDDLPGTDKICGSPWLGPAWVKNAYGGLGPFWPQYGHFFGDQELKEVAERLGVLWQREDVSQFHNHWTRPGSSPRTDYQKRNNSTYWRADHDLFDLRRKQNFPGSGL